MDTLTIVRKPAAATLAVCSVFAGPVLATETPVADEPELETILVSGEQPGLGLWKVSKGDHVLWILPSHNPLSASMVWRTQPIEARIAESQEVLYPPMVQVEPSVGFFKALSLVAAIPAALKAGKNPGGKSLRDVVPPATHARWLELRDKYFIRFRKKGEKPDEKKDNKEKEEVEQWRPAIALGMLQGWAQERSGLGYRRVDSFVMSTATKHKVPIHRLPPVVRAVKLEKNIRGMLKEASAQPQVELACFEQGLDALEPDIELARQRANAWATGDIDKLRTMLPGKRSVEDCFTKIAYAITAADSKDAANARRMLDSFIWHDEQANVQARRDWIAAAGKALDTNTSTFATLPVGDLFREGGYLDALRKQGYTVEEPVQANTTVQ